MRMTCRSSRPERGTIVSGSLAPRHGCLHRLADAESRRRILRHRRRAAGRPSLRGCGDPRRPSVVIAADESALGTTRRTRRPSSSATRRVRSRSRPVRASRDEGGRRGADGKRRQTTTKELARTLLSATRPAHASPGNLNNHYGLPWPSCARRTTPGLGTRAGDQHARRDGSPRRSGAPRGRPGHDHLGCPRRELQDFSGLCDEKMKLPRGSRSAVLNADDPEQVSRAASVPGRPRGTARTNPAWAARRLGHRIVSKGLAGSSLEILEDGVRHELHCPLPGPIRRATFSRPRRSPATSASRGTTSPSGGAREGAASSRRVLRVGGATVVDDTYNANPRACAALELLREVETSGRRIFMTGDMLELGEHRRAEHRALGEWAAPRWTCSWASDRERADGRGGARAGDAGRAPARRRAAGSGSSTTCARATPSCQGLPCGAPRRAVARLVSGAPETAGGSCCRGGAP